MEQPDGGPTMKALAVPDGESRRLGINCTGKLTQKLAYTADDGNHSAIGADQVEILDSLLCLH
jgi:hypothetical protein